MMKSKRHSNLVVPSENSHYCTMLLDLPLSELWRNVFFGELIEAPLGKALRSFLRRITRKTESSSIRFNSSVIYSNEPFLSVFDRIDD